MTMTFVCYLFLMFAVPYTSGRIEIINVDPSDLQESTETPQNVRITASCPGTYDTNKHEITSPNYPNRYSNNQNCNWLLEAPASQRIQLVVNVLALEKNSECSYDWLQAYDGFNSEAQSIGRKRCSGRAGSASIVSTSNKMYLRFKTDSSATSTGFKISYNTIDSSIRVEGSCLNTIDVNNHKLRSPNYPNRYSNNLDCTWNLHARPGQHIELGIDHMDIEKASDCRYDSLEVYDGTDSSGRSIGGKRCSGKGDYGSIVSTGNQLFLRFKTDAYTNGNGFEIWFSLTLQEQPEFTTTNYDITSYTRRNIPNYDENDYYEPYGADNESYPEAYGIPEPMPEDYVYPESYPESYGEGPVSEDSIEEWTTSQSIPLLLTTNVQQGRQPSCQDEKPWCGAADCGLEHVKRNCKKSCNICS